MRAARARIDALAGFALGALAACSTSTPAAKPGPPPPVALDASYDWHALLAAPFGSYLKDVPLTVHEVLLFRDAAGGAGSVDEPECYALDGEPPRFLARYPEEYLLCYLHDRLSRVEASVRLPRAEAAQTLRDACGLWTKNAQIHSPPTPGADGCSGADGGVQFNGRLEDDGERSESLLIVRLEAPAAPDPRTPDP